VKLIEAVRNVILEKYPDYDTKIEDEILCLIQNGEIVARLYLDEQILEKWREENDWWE